jgi:ZIP family zinc transporter
LGQLLPWRAPRRAVLAFLTLAAGSILYVVIQLTAVALRSGRTALLYRGVLAGLTAGFVTDMIVTVGGA